MPDAVVDKLKRIADMQASTLSSEEDVKINVVLPLLLALGYETSDFNYEGRTGRGYVDISGDRGGLFFCHFQNNKTASYTPSNKTLIESIKNETEERPTTWEISEVERMDDS
jgi:hypothetical protein